ncbi:MAG: hypothetical protein M0Z33_02750, partial [Actinomycetota bacterium]|nr:hypothetical protein [Actinomycetota bacterium]
MNDLEVPRRTARDAGPASVTDEPPGGGVVGRGPRHSRRTRHQSRRQRRRAARRARRTVFGR